MDNAILGTGASEAVERGVGEALSASEVRRVMTRASGVAKVSRQRKTGGTVGHRSGDASALRLLRLSRGLTLADAGALCGMTANSAAALELVGPRGKKSRASLRELLRQLRKMPAVEVRGDEGSAMRAARHRAGLSQHGLQSLTGLSYSMLSRIESGERNLTDASLSRIESGERNLTDASRARLFAEIGFEARGGLHTLPLHERGEVGRFVEVEIVVGEEPEDLARGVA